MANLDPCTLPTDKLTDCHVKTRNLLKNTEIYQKSIEEYPNPTKKTDTLA